MAPMLILAIGSHLSGCWLLWMIFPDPYLVCLPFLLKILPILIISLSALFGDPYPSKLILFETPLASSMWFLPWLSGFTFSLPILSSGHLMTQWPLDKGWSESLGPQGLFNSLMASSKKWQFSQENSIQVFMFSFFLWLSFVVLLGFYL